MSPTRQLTLWAIESECRPVTIQHTHRGEIRRVDVGRLTPQRKLLLGQSHVLVELEPVGALWYPVAFFQGSGPVYQVEIIERPFGVTAYTEE